MLPASQIPVNLAPGLTQYRPPQAIHGTSANPSLQFTAHPQSYTSYIGPPSVYSPSDTPARPLTQRTVPTQATLPPSLPNHISATASEITSASSTEPTSRATGTSRPSAKAGKQRMAECRERQKSGSNVNSTQYEQDLANPDADGKILSAYQLIIQWLQVPENFRSFVGKSQAVKEPVAGRVRELLETAGCRAGRTNSAVAGKIKAIIDRAKLGADECAKPGWGIIKNDGFASIQDKKLSLFPEYCALEDVMQDTGTARPMHLHQSSLVPEDDLSKAREVMMGLRRSESEENDEVFEVEGPGNGAESSKRGVQTKDQARHPPPTYSTPLANPSHESPEHGGRPREFESERAEQLYLRGLAHRTKDAVDAVLLDSDCDERSPPAKKRNKGPDKKHAKTSKIIEDTVTTADEAMLSKVDKIREEAVQAMKNKLAYEKEKDRKQDELRKREVGAREKEVALQDWDRAGRLAYGDKITWEELRDDMLAYAEEELDAESREGK